MSGHSPVHNDDPTLIDLLGRDDLLNQITLQIADSPPPQVFGIHGDWGSGKTSFLRQLAIQLTGKRSAYFPEMQRLRPGSVTNNGHVSVSVVWFEAWRYQNEPVPIVALLHEICAQLPKDKHAMKLLGKWANATVQGLISSLESVSVAVKADSPTGSPIKLGGEAKATIRNPILSIQEQAGKWDERNFRSQLTTERIREQLNNSITMLLGCVPKVLATVPADRRLVIIIDDLDRCAPEAAYKLLEGIKIYLNIPSCIFVLGINQREVERAIAETLSDKLSERVEERASEYLEKICSVIWKLPLINPKTRADVAAHWLGDPSGLTGKTNKLTKETVAAIRQVIEMTGCIPANPRKIKAFSNCLRHLAGAADGTAQSGRELAIRPEQARALVLAAGIYQFHPKLLRFLQGYGSRFYQRLLSWAEDPTREGNTLHEAFKDLIPMQSREGSRQSSRNEGTPQLEAATRSGSNSMQELFCDPSSASVFYLHPLLIDSDGAKAVDYRDLQPFLSLP